MAAGFLRYRILGLPSKVSEVKTKNQTLRVFITNIWSVAGRVRACLTLVGQVGSVDDRTLRARKYRVR